MRFPVTPARDTAFWPQLQLRPKPHVDFLAMPQLPGQYYDTRVAINDRGRPRAQWTQFVGLILVAVDLVLATRMRTRLQATFLGSGPQKSLRQTLQQTMFRKSFRGKNCCLFEREMRSAASFHRSQYPEQRPFEQGNASRPLRRMVSTSSGVNLATGVDNDKQRLQGIMDS